MAIDLFVQVLARVAIQLPLETLNHRGNMTEQEKKLNAIFHFTLVELNSILKALRESALEAKPFSKEGIAEVELAVKVKKVMESIVDAFPKEIREELERKDIQIWKEIA